VVLSIGFSDDSSRLTVEFTYPKAAAEGTPDVYCRERIEETSDG
jgi:hypothetical protein